VWKTGSFLIVDLLKRFIHVSAGAIATMAPFFRMISVLKTPSGKGVVDWLGPEHAVSSLWILRI
jgi:hypothetical protein